MSYTSKTWRQLHPFSWKAKCSLIEKRLKRTHQSRPTCLQLLVHSSGLKVSWKESRSQWRSYRVFRSLSRIAKNSRTFRSSMHRSVTILSNTIRARLKSGRKVLRPTLRTSSISLYFTEKRHLWLKRASFASISILCLLNYFVKSSISLSRIMKCLSALLFYTRRWIRTERRLVTCRLLSICIMVFFRLCYLWKSHYCTTGLKEWTSHWCLVSLN